MPDGHITTRKPTGWRIDIDIDQISKKVIGLTFRYFRIDSCFFQGDSYRRARRNWKAGLHYTAALPDLK